MRFEYKVVPAPKKGTRAKGVKGAESQFANALMNVMNQFGAEGWEYLRTDTLPSEVRSGLTGKTTIFQNMLVFRRELESKVPEVKAPAKVMTMLEAHGQALPTAEVVPKLPENMPNLETSQTPRNMAAE